MFKGILGRKENFSELDYESSYRLFVDNFQHQSFIEADAKQNVLVIGNADAGKSTFINYCVGCRFDPVLRFGYSLESAKFLESAKLREGSKPIVAKIGYEAQSKTLFNSFFVDEIGNYFSDSPGFSDYREREEKMCIAMSHYTTVQLTQVKGILLLVDYESFNDRGRRIHNLIQNLNKLFKSIDAVTSATTLVMTKFLPNTSKKKLQDGLNKRLHWLEKTKLEKLNDLKKNGTADLEHNPRLANHMNDLFSFIEVVRFLRSKVPTLIMGNVFDNGESAAEVQSFIRRTVVLPRDSFLLPRYSHEVVDFNAFMIKMVQKKVYLFELQQLMILQVKLNHEVSSLQERINGLLACTAESEQSLNSWHDLKLMSEDQKLNDKQLYENDKKIDEYEENLAELKKELDIYTADPYQKKIPANAAWIANLNQLIEDKEKEIKELIKDNDKLKQQNRDYNNCKNTEERCAITKSNIRQMERDLIGKQSELQTCVLLLLPIRDLFMQQHEELKLICAIDEVMGMFINQRNLIDAFIASYHHVCILLNQFGFEIEHFVRQLHASVAVVEDEEKIMGHNDIPPLVPAADIESCALHDTEDGAGLGIGFGL